MQLVRWPKQFDVIVTDNLFGDMLSDVAAMLTGSLGMLPSASLGSPDAKTGKRRALYEPVHGSAPDIAGKGVANPIAMVASFGMALRYSFDLGNGQKRAIDTQVYDTYEIERIARVAFDLARTRRNKVTSMEKRNVMKSGVLWNEVVTAVGKREYPEVTLEHMLADAGGMQLVRAPKQFDVIVTDNLFGDMLSDVAAMLTGSLGMLPSASLGAPDGKTGKRKALYEPVHGSAPDIAGTGAANPIAMIASFGMALRYSFELGQWADKVDQAIAAVLAKGIRTKDIAGGMAANATTSQMGAAILEELKALA